MILAISNLRVEAAAKKKKEKNGREKKFKA